MTTVTATRDSAQDIAKQTDNNTLYFTEKSISKGDTNIIGGKLDLDAQNLSNAGKSLIAGLGMPSDTYEDLTLLASGQSYTAPADGWVNISKKSGISNAYISIKQNDFAVQLRGIGVSDDIEGFLPISKGSFTVAYNATGATGRFRFYYAIGNESEAS